MALEFNRNGFSWLREFVASRIRKSLNQIVLVPSSEEHACEVSEPFVWRQEFLRHRLTYLDVEAFFKKSTLHLKSAFARQWLTNAVTHLSITTSNPETGEIYRRK